jgi:hypothetical protein
MFHPLLGMPQIIRLTHPQPESRAVSRDPANPQRHFSRDGMGAGQDAMQLLTRYPHSSCGFADCQSQGWKHVFTQNLARMNWWTFQRRLNGILSPWIFINDPSVPSLVTV